MAVTPTSCRTMADGQPDPAPVEELVAGAQRAAARAAAEALEAALSGLYDAFGTLLDGSMKVRWTPQSFPASIASCPRLLQQHEGD